VLPGVGFAASVGHDAPSGLTEAKWARLPSGPLSARDQETALWTGSDLLVWGGQTTSGSHMLRDGALFDPRSGKWTVIPPSPLTPRAGTSSVWTGHLALLWGGVTNDTATVSSASNSGAAFDPSTDQWTRLPPSPLSPREGATALWTGKLAIFIGGEPPNGGFGAADVDGAAYDPNTHRWAQLPSLPIKGLGAPVGVTAIWNGRELIAWSTYQTSTPFGSSGEQIRNRQVGAEWKPGEEKWTRLPSPPQGVFTATGTSTWVGGRDVITGGTNCLGAMSCPAPIDGVAELFNPKTNAWTTSPKASIFIHPDLVASVGTDLALINESSEIGGPTLDFRPGDGVLFDPAMNRDVPLPAVPMADVGQWTSMVWTGHTLLLWGAEGKSMTTYSLQLSEH
jgi:hypothetical protein